MKNLRTTVLCACITLISLCAAAQKTIPVNEPDYNKPKLFANLPDNINVNIGNLNNLLSAAVGSSISVDLGKDGSFVFRGEVVSSAIKFENTMQSIVIRSTNYPGAFLTFTRTNNADRSQAFTARIISRQNGDLYELKGNAGQYLFVKKNFYDLVNE
jgi:hypothetical protein